MAELARFNDESPIIHDIRVADKSAGYENMGKAFGYTAESLAKTAGALGEEQSNAMYLSTQAHIDSLKTDAKINFLLHPELANKIAENTTLSYNNAISSAFVNNADRTKLTYIAQKDIEDLKFESAKTSFELSKKQGMIQLYSGWPDTLRGIKESVSDPKEFEIRINSANEGINSALRVGAITPTQAETLFKSVHQIMDASAARVRVAMSGNIDAREYHRQKGGLISTDDGTHINQPVNEVTRQVYDIHNDDISLQGLKADLARGNLGNPQAWAGLTKEHTVNEVTHFGEGAFSVDSDVKHGTPITQLQIEYARLSKQALHSPYEEGRMKRIQNILVDLGNGQFENVLKGNPLFQQAEASYNQARAAIQSSVLPDDKKGQLIRSYDNDLTYKKATLGEAMHIDSKDIHPIASHFTDEAKLSWGLNANPNELIMRLDYFDKPLREYFARAQDTPVHQEVTRVVASLDAGTIVPNKGILSAGFKVTESDRADFVLANQSHRDFSNLQMKGDRDKAIRTEIAKNMSKTLSFVGSQVDGGSRGSALVDATMNLVKYYAQRNGDIEMKNINSYVRKATALVNASYPVVSGSGWTINQNDIPLTASQMDVVSKYMIQEASNTLAADQNRVVFDEALGSNNLTVKSLPTGKLVVVDGYGDVHYETRYNGNLLHYAYGKVKDNELNIPVRGKVSESVIAGNEDLTNLPKVENPNEEDFIPADEKEEYEKALKKGKRGSKLYEKVLKGG